MIRTTLRPDAAPLNADKSSELPAGYGLILGSVALAIAFETGIRAGHRAPSALRCIPSVATFDVEKSPSRMTAVAAATAGFVSCSVKRCASNGKPIPAEITNRMRARFVGERYNAI